MLRPERMSKVSVTGSKAVMRDVIEAVHELNLLHLTDYDGSWEGFEPGAPIEGADEASDKLVTVRSIESILDVDPDDAGPTRIVTDDALDEEVAEIRREVNELDDRRDDLADELRTVEERLDSMDPFATLGIDLDLLSGYDSIEVRVGEGRAEAVEDALSAAAGVDEFEIFAEDGVVAVFARAESPEALDEALVGTDFATLDIPDAEGSPGSYAEELRHERQKLASKLDSVQNELDDLELEVAGFLLAAEETLTIDVQKSEAPLTFATTEHSFVAEGWVPTERYDGLTAALRTAVGDHVNVEELERASYGEQATHTPEPEGEAATDGGHVRSNDGPPVVQDNPDAMKPFELLVETINRPKYYELDPTVVLFLTFPLFFGFMIGDLGYGVLYMLIGYLIYAKTDSLALKSLGGIAMWAGGFTVLFGILYGEIFGFHIITEYVWSGHPPIEKGLSPATVEFAQLWMLASVFAGIVHMTIGWTFDFVEHYESHGFGEALLESGSWIMLTVGLWVWVLSLSLQGSKPAFLFTVLGHGEEAAIPLGFTGFPASVGIAAAAVAAVGLVLVLKAEGIGIGLIESITQAFAHVISYTRLAAVLLAKAGMAFVVNLLVFGAYQTVEGEYHFLTSHGPQWVAEHHPEATVMFGGLTHAGVGGVLAGLLILVLGHLLVLALGITSAGLQAIRLEYVEFFGKFYGGGGDKYEPFGYDRAYTTED